MFIIYWLLLVTSCLQEAYCQCSGSTLHVQLQMLKKEYIATPNFPSSNYSQNLTCVWCIDSSNVSSRILFKVRYVRTTTNTMDILRIYEGSDDTGQPIEDSESELSLNREVVNVITGSTLFVTFTTDDDSTNNGSGFELYVLESQDYSGAPCTETIQLQAENTEKFITSPNFPNNYNKSNNCSWNISNTENTEVLISVIYMDVEVDTPLKCYDSVQIGDSKKLCADKDMSSSFTYRSNSSVIVTFISDKYQAKGGFALSYIKQSYIVSEITQTTISSIYLSTDDVDYTSASEKTTDKTNSVFISTGRTTTLVTLSSNKQTTEIFSTIYISTDGTGMDEQSSPTTSTVTDLKSTSSLAIITEEAQLTTATSRQTTFISSNAPKTTSTEKTTKTTEQEETSTMNHQTSTFNERTQQETSSQLKTISLTTIITGPPTEATHTETSIKYQTTTFSDTTTQEVTTSQNIHDSTVSIETTTTQMNTTKDNAVLSPEAQAGIITGAVIGVAGVGLLLGASVYLVFQSLGGNPVKGKGASRKTNDIQITDDNMPRWIKMIETMKKSPYDPTYKN